MSEPRSLVAGNWKMNGVAESIAELNQLNSLLASGGTCNCDVMICPPYTLLNSFVEAEGSVLIGAQDCHANKSGAHTGDISATMIKDCGATHVIVGHSERRADHGETSENVSAKASAAIAENLGAIVCVGETEAERDAGQTLDVVLDQVKKSVPSEAAASDVIIAYEPVWAIGTGRTPTTGDVEEVHKAIREQLVSRFGDEGNSIAILYGGSVKPANAEELMAVPNVNGALVGGASLKAADFNGIIDAYRK